MTVQLSNTSALGTFRFDWRSKFDGASCSVQWGDGMRTPLACMGPSAVDVRDPERFGFKRPVTIKSFKEFVQRFADEFEEGPGDE